MGYYKNIFSRAGWFIPNHATRGYLNEIAEELERSQKPDIESYLERLYSSYNLAAMVTERYPIVPFINEYKKIISESIEAHFLGLNYAAVTTLIPVVEGVGQKLVDEWNIERKNKVTKQLFSELIKKCKTYVITNQIGNVKEIVPALEAFKSYLNNNFYIGSGAYKFDDNTNRHGILHGTFKDSDYGNPMNFYKTIGAVEFLCFIISIREPISFFAPSPSGKSNQLALYYDSCSENSIKRENIFT